MELLTQSWGCSRQSVLCEGAEIQTYLGGIHSCSTGGLQRVVVNLRATRGSPIEWTPRASILFPGAVISHNAQVLFFFLKLAYKATGFCMAFAYTYVILLCFHLLSSTPIPTSFLHLPSPFLILFASCHLYTIIFFSSLFSLTNHSYFLPSQLPPPHLSFGFLNMVYFS